MPHLMLLSFIPLSLSLSVSFMILIIIIIIVLMFVKFYFISVIRLFLSQTTSFLPFFLVLFPIPQGREGVESSSVVLSCCLGLNHKTYKSNNQAKHKILVATHMFGFESRFSISLIEKKIYEKLNS